MTARWLATALVCAGAAVPSPAAATAQEMTFHEVLEAARHAPTLARLATEVEAAEAAAVTAGTYPYNPTVELEVGDRDGAEGSTTDRVLTFSQQLELGGQRGKRRAVASQDLEAARAAFAQARREVLAAAALAFAEAATRRELLAVQESEAELARGFAALVERRLEAGSATAVDLALAQAGLARTERGVAVAQGLYRGAQARVAEVAGVSGTALVVPVDDVPVPEAPPELDDLLARAADGRGDLAAARDRLEAAEARLRLARAARLPDLTVAARAGREEGDDIVGLSFAVPLPLFHRNRGEIAEARAGLAAARSELAVQELLVRREVAAAHGRLTAARESRRLAERLGVTPLEEGLALLQRSFEAGKIGAAELLLFRRELVEGRRQAVEARAEAWQAATELALAVGTALPGMEWIEETETEP